MGSAFAVLLCALVLCAGTTHAVSLSELISPSFYADSPSSIHSPVHGAVQGDYWTTEDFLTPASSRDAGSPVTIPTSFFDTSSSDEKNTNNTGGLVAAVVLSVCGAAVFALIVFACLFYLFRSSSWGKTMRGYDKHEPDTKSDTDADMELAQYDALNDL